MNTEKISEQPQDETVGSMTMEPNDKAPVELSEEEKVRMDEIKALVEAETLDPTTSINILINAVQVAFDSELYNDLDRYLIAKSLNCFKDYVEKGEDVVIKVK
jgi:hypothetical protein